MSTDTISPSSAKINLATTVDITRWSDNNNLSVAWDERAKIAAGMIAPQSKVLDVGCGRMALEQLLDQCEYFPLDVVKRDHRTTVVDLNSSPLPNSLLSKVNTVTFLGVFEYLKDPESILRELSRQGITVVCSYQLADRSDAKVRAANGWFNAYTALEFSELITRSNFEIKTARKYGEQGIYLLTPIAKPTRSFGLSSLYRKRTSQPVQIVPSTPAKPRLVLSGFFGRGNVGDEAILQVQYEKLSPYFDITISVEQRGAFDGYWNWYPYNLCNIINHADTSIFSEPDVIGLHIGGGDLPIGFNGGQVIGALANGKRVISSGVDIGRTYQAAARNNPDVVATYLSWTKPWIRSVGGYEQTQPHSDRTKLGADWAIELPTDNAPDALSGANLLVIRELALSAITPQFRASLTRFIRQAQDTIGPIVLLPFCPEDERFLDSLECTWGLNRELHWWNPRRIKQLIAQAKQVISIGRFHPVVFAASTSTPCLYTEWSKEHETLKAQRFCEETNSAYAPCMDEAAAVLSKGITAGAIPETYKARFDTMFQQVVNALTTSSANR